MPRRRPLPDLRGAAVATRAGLLAAGCSAAQVRTQLATGRWQVLHSGVYALFAGPVPPRIGVEAAVLRAGKGACAGPWTTLWLAGALDEPPRTVDVVVPLHRHVTCPGIRVLRRTGLAAIVHPAAHPPRMRLEEAVLDACDSTTRAGVVVDLVISVVQRRLTTAARLAAALEGRARHRWRGLLEDLLADVETGVRSALERRFLRKVLRPHGLPVGEWNAPDRQGPRRVYRDLRYRRQRVLVELDGRLSHPFEEAFRDRRRDNAGTVEGDATLRYGWFETEHDPCGSAAELDGVLRRRGAPGGHPCSPGCPVGRDPGGSMRF